VGEVNFVRIEDIQRKGDHLVDDVEALDVPDNRIILFQPAPDLVDSPGANVMHGLPYL
jgi:hypothetical protein